MLINLYGVKVIGRVKLSAFAGQEIYLRKYKLILLGLVRVGCTYGEDVLVSNNKWIALEDP